MKFMGLEYCSASRRTVGRNTSVAGRNETYKVDTQTVKHSSTQKPQNSPCMTDHTEKCYSSECLDQRSTKFNFMNYLFSSIAIKLQHV